jgi:copper chaperone CopZ
MTSDTLPAELIFTVLGVPCSHCESAVTAEVGRVQGVTAVEVDLDSMRVTVSGARLDEWAVRQAIEQAGCDVER